MCRFLSVVGLGAYLCLPALAADPVKLPPAADRKIDFEKDVKPILSAYCWKCHGPEKQKGGLRLDTRTGAITGGDSGAVITPGKSAESKLSHAVLADANDEIKMPPGEARLAANEVGVLQAWIDQGLSFPESKEIEVPAVVKSNHWAFQKISKPKLPAEFSGNPIDHFIRARLKLEGVKSSPEADRVTLVRRLSFDLLGLPPSPSEVDEFLTDTSPNAYEKLVERLLASPHYGERWGRHWLDAARYADSDGYEKDTGRPFAWRYREWVIGALNADTPFDQFSIEQLAGDLLPNATTAQKAATGFHRNTLTNKEGGADPEEFRVAAVVDRVSTTGKVWLGLTVGCAQCHDHKYDPISQREFYQLFAFFNSDKETDLAVPLAGEAEKVKKAQTVYGAKLGELKAALAEAKAEKLPAADLAKRQKALAAHEKTAPVVSKLPTISAGPTRTTSVLIRGDFLRKGVEVTAGTPGVLPKSSGSKTLSRLELARWLVGSDNPLTPRVAANWVWAKFFGRGLVATPEDFGTQGEKPTHPELLDWLAAEFQDPAGCGWSLKKLHTLIVTSATYRQSSVVSSDLVEHDPLNVLLARQSRLRIEAEIIRDNALAASGLLTRVVGGPSIRPPQPAGISELTYANSAKWVESTGPDRYRRGLYVWFQRTSPYPMLMTFDSPDSNVCVVRRERSNTPLQALALLNDSVFVESAQALASRVLADRRATADGSRLSLAFRYCFARTPSQREGERLVQLLNDLRAANTDTADATKLLGTHVPKGVPPAEAAAWVGLCRTLMNLDEFVTRE